MTTKNIQIAEKLVNNLLNEIIDRWASDPIGKCYLLRHAEGSDGRNIIIQPTYDNAFYNLEDFVNIAQACGCSFYVDCQENLNGIMIPTIHIY